MRNRSGDRFNACRPTPRACAQSPLLVDVLWAPSELRAQSPACSAFARAWVGFRLRLLDVALRLLGSCLSVRRPICRSHIILGHSEDAQDAIQGGQRVPIASGSTEAVEAPAAGRGRATFPARDG
jgi:hypothetical protein